MARPGGESDKFGNTYEGAWTVHHMLLVLAGRAKAIIVEDIGDRARWLRDRVDGVVETLTGTTIRAASAEGGGVQLALDGARETRMEVDHVMCGTGFPVDITRLPFFPKELRARITTVAGHPMLSRAGESSVRGLYFAGVHAAASLGPSMRFVAGTHNVARILARSVRSSQARS